MLESFRSRLVISNLLLTLLGLLIVVAVFVQLLAQRSYDIKRYELAKQARAVASQIHRLYLGHGTAADLRARVYDASRLLGERIIVVGSDGQHTVDSSKTTPFDSGSWYAIDTRALRNGRSASASKRSQNLLLFQAPIRGTGTRRNGGAVLLVAKVRDVRPSLSSLLTVVVSLAGTALFVWIVIGTYFTYSVFRPLLRITNATVRMARGEYSARVPVKGSGEIARLAASFNSMASQVQRTNQAQRDFVANVSHDLRTPLTMIAGFSQALLDGTAPPEEFESLAEVISTEAGKMQQLVDDLLQMTKLEAGLLTLDCRPVQTWPYVQAIVDRMAKAAGAEAGVRIENKTPASAPAIDVDPDRFERVLRNLLDNALQYTLQGGTVTVDAVPHGRGLLLIRVADTGIGIAPEDLPRVFERFYRSDRSRERASGHSGLGLAIVREIVEAHGGKVGVESEVGKGTVFSITVPRAHAGSGAGTYDEPVPESVAR